jgi:hypothetical protein
MFFSRILPFSPHFAFQICFLKRTEYVYAQYISPLVSMLLCYNVHLYGIFCHSLNFCHSLLVPHSHRKIAISLSAPALSLTHTHTCMDTMPFSHNLFCTLSVRYFLSFSQGFVILSRYKSPIKPHQKISRANPLPWKRK